MRNHPAVAIGVSGTALVALCFAIALEISAESVARPAPAPAASNAINRTLKGDRLPTIVRPSGAEPYDVRVPEQPRPRMTDGCESVFGPIDQSPSARVVGRCVT